MTAFTSAARVVTDAPARYATQLTAHLGHKLTVEAGPEGDRIILGAGSCLLRVASVRRARTLWWLVWACV